ncbi:hypothetical protein [Pirellula sp. SH-Sr6A]|uniref:hypothetical protein n=1 Tax=Pirellula sp. SH-Sr6A TaxID=1632865 RepID=UPI00143BF570|nr:hypothetical protein [Pirellula sp. SH-Sr6A]
MTNEMPTRKSPTSRARDWGNTPILFSLKNVQPLLVVAPPRPEGNVAAPPSIAADTPTATSPAPTPAPFSLEPEGPRVKPRAISKLGSLLKNSIAVTLLVLLVLLVIKISVSDSPLGKPSASSSTSLESSIPPEIALDPIVVPSPAAPSPSIASSPVATPHVATPHVETASANENAAPIPSVQPPLLLTASNPNPPMAQPASSDSATRESMPELEGNKSAFAVRDEEIPARFNQPAPSPAYSSMKPTDMAPSAATEPPMFFAPSPAVSEPKSGLDISIHTTSTPDLPTDSVIDLWNRANGKASNAALSTTKQPVPYTPVSSPKASPTAPSSYQPISTGWDLATPALPVSNASSVPNSTTKPAISSPTPSWSNLTPSGQPSATTPLSGQPYPPKAQEYRPLTVQPTEPATAPNLPAGTVNRYQPIRQPSGAATSTGTSFGYPAIQ